MALYTVRKSGEATARFSAEGSGTLSKIVAVSPGAVITALPPGKKQLATYFGGEVPVAVATHPVATVTCKEKIDALGWWFLHEALKRTIKCVVFQNKDEEGKFYFFIIPGKKDGSFIDVRSVSEIVNFNAKKKFRLVPEGELPWDMKNGTCTPLLPPNGKGEIGGIFFDGVHIERRRGRGPDDLSVAIGFEGLPDHQLSVFMNYADLFDLLRKIFGEELVHAVDMKYEKKELRLERFGHEADGLARFFSGIEHVLERLNEKKVNFDIVQTNMITSDGRWMELLGLQERNLLRTIYYEAAGKFYGLVLPATDFFEVMNFSLDHSCYQEVFEPGQDALAEYFTGVRKIELPPGMYYDATSPFLDGEAREQVRKIVFSLNCEFKDDEMVAVSLGLAPGYPAGQKTALLLPFGALRDLIGGEGARERRNENTAGVWHHVSEGCPNLGLHLKAWETAGAILLETFTNGGLPDKEILFDAISKASARGAPVFLASGAFDRGLRLENESVRRAMESGAIPLAAQTKKMAYFAICAASESLKSGNGLDYL